MVEVNLTDSTGFVQAEQAEQSANLVNPGFTQAPIQANIPPPQTFYPPATAAPTAYSASTAYASPTAYAAPSFVSPPSLAPMGAGLPSDSTSYDVGPSGSGGSDIPWGTIAGGGALATALAAYGDDDGSGLSFNNLLSGAKKLFELGDMSGTDILGKLPQELQDIVKNIVDAPGDLLESIFGTTPTAPTTASGLFSGAGPIFSAPGVAGMFPGAAASTAALQSAVAAQVPGHTLASLSASGFSPMGGALAGATALGTPAGAMVSSAFVPELAGIAATGVGGAGAGGFAAMGAAGPLALAGIAFMAISSMKKDDPTLTTRRANEFENVMQLGGGGINHLIQMVYADPSILPILKKATGPVGNGVASFETPHTSGGTDVIRWSPKVSAKVQVNMDALEKAQNAGKRARSVGQDIGLHGAIPTYVPGGGSVRFDAYTDPFGTREREARALARGMNQPYNPGVVINPPGR